MRHSARHLIAGTLVIAVMTESVWGQPPARTVDIRTALFAAQTAHRRVKMKLVEGGLVEGFVLRLVDEYVWLEDARAQLKPVPIKQIQAIVDPANRVILATAPPPSKTRRIIVTIAIGAGVFVLLGGPYRIACAFKSCT